MRVDLRDRDFRVDGGGIFQFNLDSQGDDWIADWGRERAWWAVFWRRDLICWLWDRILASQFWIIFFLPNKNSSALDLITILG